MENKSRGIVILYEDLSDSWTGLMKEAELTTLGVHKIAVPGTGSVDSLLSALAAPDGRRIINRLEKEGITVEYELHALEWLLPRGLFGEHPDYFRMNTEGARTPDLNCCPSSPGALDVISENAYRLAGMLRQTSERYFLWPDDAAGSACGCEMCRGLNRSDQLLRIDAAVLRGLRAYDPDAKLSFLSYSDTLELPSAAPGEGIFLEFAPMARDHAKPINSPDNPSGKIYTDLLPQLLGVFGPGETHILEYWLDNALFSGYRMPPVKVPFYPDVAEADVRYYTDLGIRNIKTFGSFIGEEYFALHGTPPVREYGGILKKYIR